MNRKTFFQQVAALLAMIVMGIVLITVIAPQYLDRFTNVVSRRALSRNLGRYELWVIVGWIFIAGGIIGLIIAGFRYLKSEKDKQSVRKETDLLYQHATRGDVEAQKQLAARLEKGIGTPVNPRLAKEWYHKAALQGDPDAQFSYAGYFWAYTDHDEDYPSALAWYEKAAQQGHAASLNALGVFHQEGYGTPVDYARAMDYYQRAGEAGDRRAWYLMGLMYLEGQGVAADRNRALELLRQSARMGHRPAEDKLAQLTGGKMA